MKSIVALALLLGFFAIIPYAIWDHIQVDFLFILAYIYAYAVALTTSAAFSSLIIFASSHGERRLLMAMLTLNVGLILVGLIFSAHYLLGVERLGATPPHMYTAALIMSYVPLGYFGVQKLAREARFISSDVLLSSATVLIALAMIEYLSIFYTSEVYGFSCITAPYIALLALDIVMIFIYFSILIMYWKTESTAYWITIVVYSSILYLMHLSLLFTSCSGGHIYEWPNVLYDFAFISLLCGLTYIREKEVKLLSYSEVEMERKRYAQLYRRVKDMQEVLQLINRMLRHDILNRLHVISGYIEAYNMSDDKAYLDKAVQAVKECSSYIDKIRELERVMSMESETLRPIRIREVVDEIIKNYDVRSMVRGDCVALADEAIYSVIDNIISNAVRHGKTERIDVWLEEVEDECEIRICDYGVGIPSEVRRDVFREGVKFGEYAGSGLGLYIVKKVVDRYGGRVWIEDSKPQGTTFVIRLKSVRRSLDKR